jgi:hypothetical protein
MRKENKKKRGGRKGVYGGKTHLYQDGTPPGTNAPHHLYWRTCTGSIPGTNEVYRLVQK